MHRVGHWLERARSYNATPVELDAVAEARNMEVALKAAELIMDDDIEGAERQLAQGSSAFHKLARGTLGFMKATLGFEQEIMRQATETLGEAETAAYQFHQRAQSDPNAFSSTIYEKGSEFALCQAEAQIMSAIVGILNESLTESIKGFYKMRKAYYTLDNLAQQEQKFMRARAARGHPISRQQSSESVRSVHSYKGAPMPNLTIHQPISARPTTPAPARPSNLRSATGVNDSKDGSEGSDEFFDADNSASKTSGRQGYFDQPHRGSPPEERLHHLTISSGETPLPSGMNTPLDNGAMTPNLPPIDPNKPALLTADADSDIFQNSLDVFIHSGVNLMSGVINIMLSVIPPVFSRLLSIVGFRGDRERGLRMLWQASKFSNVNGGMAALIIFGWYNGLIGFCDILTDSDPTIKDDINGFPIERLTKLLAVMRTRYPQSYLWKLEEARMYSNRRELNKAIDFLSEPGQKSQLKQLEALAMFELSLNAMNSHNYTLCAKSFINCIALNEWSPTLYHYAAASAYLQIYRDNKSQPGKASVAEEYKKLALKHFKEAPTHVGKKKLMGKQMPFDTFVQRKIAKWTAKSQVWGCEFIDAIGISPIEEVSYLWNGHKKMNKAQLEQSLANLAWSENPKTNPHWDPNDIDEQAILALLRSSVLRNLRQHDQAIAELQKHILNHDATVFKGLNKDDWTAPAANYEMAVNYWMQRREYLRRYGSTLAGLEADTDQVPPITDLKHDATMVAEARKYNDKAKNWGAYELDTRIGMKVTAANSSITRWELKHKDLVTY